MKKKFKISDNVILDKEEILKEIGSLPNWYSENKYKIIDIYSNSGSVMIKLDKNLSHNSNRIFFNYLKFDIKEERKNKLLKLKNV